MSIASFSSPIIQVKIIRNCWLQCSLSLLGVFCLTQNRWVPSHLRFLRTILVDRFNVKVTVTLCWRVKLKGTQFQLSGWSCKHIFKQSCDGLCVFVMLTVEPVGSKGPVFTNDDKVNSFSRLTNKSLSMLCPAQGYPVPSFRCDFLPLFLFSF